MMKSKANKEYRACLNDGFTVAETAYFRGVGLSAVSQWASLNSVSFKKSGETRMLKSKKRLPKPKAKVRAPTMDQLIKHIASQNQIKVVS